MPSAEDWGIRRCQRCGYRGDGVGYFGRPGHAFLIFALGVITYGIGALIYWLSRRHNLVCPNCGLDWQHSRLLAEPDPSPPSRITSRPIGENDPLPHGGGIRQALGVGLLIGGLVILGIGIAEVEAGAIIAGFMVGLTGVAAAWWGFAARENRRSAIRSQMQTRILRMAGQHQGKLTVSTVAAEMGIGLPAAEKLLVGMEDGLRVRSEIDRSGVIMFEFPEFATRDSLPRGSDPSALG